MKRSSLPGAALVLAILAGIAWGVSRRYGWKMGLASVALAVAAPFAVALLIALVFYPINRILERRERLRSPKGPSGHD